MKKALNIAIILMLALGTLAVLPIFPAKAYDTKVKVLNPDSTHDKSLVDPANWTASVTYDTKYDGTPAGPGDIVFHTDTRTGDMFYIDVFCENVVGLWNWQVNMTFDPAILEVLNAYIPPTSKFNFAVTPPPTIDNENGFVLIGSSRLGGQPGVSGSDVLARIVFSVKRGAGYLEHLFCNLDLVEGTRLKDPGMVEIPCDIEDGYYEIFWVIPPAPSIYVSPIEYKAKKLYEDVKIDIYVQDVDPAWEIIGFQFVLRFNQTLIEPNGYDPGTFMEAFANGGESVLYVVTHDYIGDPALPEGYNAFVVAVILLPGPSGWVEPYPSGTGLLVSLHFNATYETIAPNEAWTDLSFTTLMCNPFVPEDDIECYALNHYMTKIRFVSKVGGRYRAPVKVLGLALDVYTQYPYPYGGQEWNKPSDSFAPQEQVELYALLTYNGDPVQQKLVGFHIKHGEYEIYREATTNDIGIAHVSFRPPWPCVDPENETLGEWFVRATADVAEKVANDTVCFKVWWHVEVVSIEPKQTTYIKRKPGISDALTFVMTFRTYRMQPVPVNLTAVVYDNLGFFIGSDVHEIEAFGWGSYDHYCEFYVDTWEITIPMPSHAMVGPATVYGNAFNNLPWDYGTPYCPEVENETEFYIALP